MADTIPSITKSRLDFKKSVQTITGFPVEIYFAGADYLNGAWYDNMLDRWIPGQWTISGFYIFNKQTGLDLINGDN